jgi:hypothetical protein
VEGVQREAAAAQVSLKNNPADEAGTRFVAADSNVT